MASSSTRKSKSKSTSTSSDSSLPLFVSIAEGRGMAKGEIGFAAFDPQNATLTLSQFGDGTKYTILMALCECINANVIIIPNTLCKSTDTDSLFKVLNGNFYDNKSVNVIPFERRFYNHEKGLEMIMDLCFEQFETIEIDIKLKYYCLSAAAALLKYIEMEHNTIIGHKSIRVVFQTPEKKMMIDPITAKALELIVNLNDPMSRVSLFGTLNRTQTRSGFRVLRSNILQPLTDRDMIEARLDIITEILENPEMHRQIEVILNRFGIIDIERLMPTLVQIPKQNDVQTAENKIENIIFLKHILTLIEPLKLALNDGKHPILRNYVNQLSDERFNKIMKLINEVIDSECRVVNGALNIKRQKCFALKSDLNPLLDAAREAYSDATEDIGNLVQEMAEHNSLLLRTAYTVSRGFHVQMTVIGNKTIRLPIEAIRVSKTRNVITFTTDEIMKRNNRTILSSEEIYLISNSVISELLDKIRGLIVCFHNLIEIIGNLDLVYSFASVASSNSNYSRPKFDNFMALCEARHPMLEYFSKVPPVPNNVLISEYHNFQLITGPNMSGKSIYLKMCAVLQVMAQIGSYVPSEDATFRVSDRIFSRIGSDIDHDSDCSTFKMEMRGAAYIINNITDKSLVIMDEIGRGTSSEEGSGIAWAIAEVFIRSKAFTLFTSHFLQLTELEKIYYNVQTHHFIVEHKSNSRMTHFTHALESGATFEENYGIKIAEMTSLNRDVIEMAKEIAEKLKASKKVLMPPKTSLWFSAESISELVDEPTPESRAQYNLAAVVKERTKSGYALDNDDIKSLKEQYNDDIQYYRKLYRH